MNDCPPLIRAAKKHECKNIISVNLKKKIKLRNFPQFLSLAEMEHVSVFPQYSFYSLWVKQVGVTMSQCLV
jgi:hypothetical protein